MAKEMDAVKEEQNHTKLPLVSVTSPTLLNTDSNWMLSASALTGLMVSRPLFE